MSYPQRVMTLRNQYFARYMGVGLARLNRQYIFNWVAMLDPMESPVLRNDIQKRENGAPVRIRT